jgi:hypothetical protein
MVQRDYYMRRNDGVVLYRSYSDEGYYIRQVETGNVYSEAIDVDGAPYTYEETDELIHKEETDNEKD